MKRLILLAVALTLAAHPLGAATFNACVETDKLAYLSGETVHWTIYAWVDWADGTDGIALLGMHLQDDLGETLNPADREELFPGLSQLEGTAFGLFQGFGYQFAGVVDAGNGALVDMHAADVNCDDHISNVGEDDGTPPLPQFAQGSYVVNVTGLHTLMLSLNAANYWDNSTATRATGFENSALQSTHFCVIVPVQGDANVDTRVDGGDLALWQQNYDPLGTGNNTFAMGNWNADNKIDGGDLALWQQNYDPIGQTGLGPGPIAYDVLDWTVTGALGTLGDANLDNKVDGGDIAIWSQNYDPLGEDNNTWAMGDFDGDGRIDSFDLALWQQNYDPLGVSGLATVPEPTTALYLLMGAGGFGAWFGRRQRRR